MACAFCKGRKNLIESNEHMSFKGDFFAGITVSIDGNLLNVFAVADTYEPNSMEAEAEIFFCPMCGEELVNK